MKGLHGVLSCRVLVAVLICAALLLPLQAQGNDAGVDAPLPQLFDVMGVAADDRLNVRSGPGTGYRVISTLAPDATGVEVVARNAAGTWGQVNTGERAGWVALHFMRARGVHIDNYNLPVGIRCFGTEPFWSLTHDGAGQLVLDAPGKDPQPFALEIAQDSGIPGDLRRMLRATGSAGVLTGYAYPAMCDDGMSDRRYGLALGLMPRSDGPLLTGCCTLAP